MINKIIDILLSPIKWFWTKYEEYIEEDSIWKIVTLFILSLGGLAAIGFVLVWVIAYVINYHPELILIGGLIIWLYAYAKTRTKKNHPVEPKAPQAAHNNSALLDEKAQNRLPLITNIIFKCFREVAAKLGCNIPLREDEICMDNNRYRFQDNFIVYIFRLEKEDIKAPWNIELWYNYTTIVQSKLRHMISSNMFRGIGYPVSMDKFGDSLNQIYIFDISDEVQYLHIYVVFDCPEYQEYLKRTNAHKNIPPDDSIPNAKWDDKKP